MITVTIHKKGDLIESCKFEGHACFKPEGMDDIVCSAVSAITCTALLGLEEIAQDKGHWENGKGYTIIEPHDPSADRVQTILQTMLLGVVEISRQFPQCVSIRFE